MVGRLALALAAGGLVGLERERRDRQAGLRTHMLVCVGSTLVTLVSILMADQNADRTRIAAQIVSGIGFLGAGTIFRAGNAVRGLTTAAGLWTVAGIGMAIGAGGALLYLGLITAALVFAVNEWLRALENRWLRQNEELELTLERGQDVLPAVLDEIARREIDVHRVFWQPDQGGPDEVVVGVRIRHPSREELDRLVSWLGTRPGIRRVEREEQ